MRKRTGYTTAAAFAIAGLVLGACGNDDDAASDIDDVPTVTDPAVTDPADDADADAVSVSIADFAFNPVNLTAEAGAEVTVANGDTAPHTYTADDGEFDSGTLSPGDSGSITAPDSPGSYDVHCAIHPAMSGTLTVEG